MILEKLSNETGVSIAKLTVYANSAHHRYKTYKIRKRSKGWRKISQPSREIKFIQRWLNKNLFAFLPVHDSVYSYKQNLNIKDMAVLHAPCNYLLKLDFEDFFPSLTKDDVRVLLSNKANLNEVQLSEEDMEFVLKIVSRYGALSIGAPSSPILSNALLFDFDKIIVDSWSEKGLIYTRYADDLIMSTNEPNLLESVQKFIHADLLNRKHPSLILNADKSVFTSRKRRRVITGLTLTSDRKVSIGREKKRYIRSLVFQYSNEKLKQAEISYLRGYLSYVISVEPVFIERLRKKYGSKIIDQLMNENLLTQKVAPIINRK